MTESSLPRFRCVLLRRSGATEIRVVRAADAGAARAMLEAAGLNPVSVEAVGPSLFDNLGERLGGRWSLPRWRPRWPRGTAAPPRTVLIGAGLIVASIPFTTAIAAWGLTALNHLQAQRLGQRALPALAAYRRAAAIEAARPHVATTIAAPTVSETTARLAAALPAGAGLVSLSRGDGGELTLAIETPDPDSLRPALAADPGLGGLREVGQTMTDGGTISVTFRGRDR